MTQHQKIPESLITFESLDRLAELIQRTKMNRWTPAMGLENTAWQNLTGDTAVLADMLLARCGGVPHKINPPSSAWCVVDTPLYERYHWACDQEHNEFEYFGLDAWRPIMFYMVDKKNTPWKIDCRHRDMTTIWTYGQRCRLIRLFDDLGMLET